METNSNKTEQNTIPKPTPVEKTVLFFLNYGIVIAPIFLFLLFMFLLMFFYIRTPSSQTKLISLTSLSQTSTVQPTVDLNPQVSTSSAWFPIHFSEKDFGSTPFTKTFLPNGAIQYLSTTNTPGRPQEIIVKDGIIIFHRIPVFNTPIEKYINYYGNPDYIAKNLHFWGSNTATYIYPAKGFAFTANTGIQLTYEQITFQPGPVEQFEQYDSDFSGDIEKF